MSDWLRLLRQNGFAIGPAYAARASVISCAALFNSFWAVWEKRLYQKDWEAVEVRNPVFLVGHGRSGTTHLHQLLSRDRRFAFCTDFDASFPHTFLSTRSWLTRLLAPLAKGKRLQDNVAVSLFLPAEDELAYLNSTLYSPYLGQVFPRNWRRYEPYRTFLRATEREREQWLAAVYTFCRKLLLQYGPKQLLLKTPMHFARIRLLLKIFPDAHFIHIHRDPYAVLQSKLHAIRLISSYFTLQKPPETVPVSRIIDFFAEESRAFLEQRSLIPEGQLHELAFESLVKDRLGHLNQIYEFLRVPMTGEALGSFQEFDARSREYQKNRHDSLPDSTVAEFEEKCGFWIREYGRA